MKRSVVRMIASPDTKRQVGQHVPALISEVKHHETVKNKVCIVVNHVCWYRGDRQIDTETDRQADRSQVKWMRIRMTLVSR
jgi:hypothetical protein